MNYLNLILYIGYFFAIIGTIFGLVNGFYQAQSNINEIKKEYEVNNYMIINEYLELIFKNIFFFGIILFIVGILFTILFPFLFLYLCYFYIKNKIRYLFI